MNKNKPIPILIIEDDVFINAIIEEIIQENHHLEIIQATTRDESMKILNTRNDIKVAFVDWFLENETSEWIIKNIYSTQLWITEIFATSSSNYERSMQIISEWATSECSKSDILTRLISKKWYSKI